MSDKRVVSYGGGFDECIEIESLSDELRFKFCMKLYKTHQTIEALEKAVKRKSLVIVEGSK
jgi:hypothetical protein